MIYIEMAAKQTGSAIALGYLVQSLIEEMGELGEIQRVEERLAYAFADIDSLLADEFSRDEEFRTLLADFVDGEETDALAWVESGFRNAVRSSSDLAAQFKKDGRPENGGAGR